MSVSELLSNVDAAWLHMDSPANLAMITGVLMFNEPIDFARLAATLEHRLLPWQRFRQHIKEPLLGIGLPRWEIDPHFNLVQHLVRVRLPSPGNLSQLQQLAGQIMSTPLDRAHPLWRMYLVENFGRGCAVIACFHHCIADGVALVRTLLSMTDTVSDAPWPTPARKTPPPHSSALEELIVPALDVARHPLRSAQAALHNSLEAINHLPDLKDLVAIGGLNAIALSKLVLLDPDRPTLFKGQCAAPKRTVWSKPVQLNDVKAVGRALNGTVNDVLQAAIVGSLRRYLVERGQSIRGLNIRALVPVNLRSPAELTQLGNRFGLVLLSLPVGLGDPLQRLHTLKKRMDEIKESPEALVAFNVLGTMGLTPIQIESIILRFFASKASVVMTNVPGPCEPLYLAGQKIENLMFWVPAPGNLGLGLSVLSYAGMVTVGVMTDAGLVPDPETIIAGFETEFETMKRSVLVAAELATPPVQVDHCIAQTRSGLGCKNRPLPGSARCRVHQAA